MPARRTRRASGRAKPTIHDVAAGAGVSVATVSRALSGRGSSSPSARERVLAVATELGFRPSRSARVLRSGRSRVIGVMLPVLVPLYAEWLRGAQEAARRHDYILLVCDGQNSMRLVEEQLDRLFSEGIDGLLLAGTTPAPVQIGRFLAADVPVGPDLSHRTPGLPLRAEEWRPATLAAFRHLAALGHRHIAYVAIVDRDEGYLSTLQRFRIGCLEEAIASARGARAMVERVRDRTTCQAAVHALMTCVEPPTALVAGTSMLTPVILSTLAAEGRDVPDDVSFLAFDESDWEAAYRPPLAVVRHDYFGIAYAQAEDLIARIEGRARPRPRAFPAEFLTRGSLGPPPAPARKRSLRTP